MMGNGSRVKEAELGLNIKEIKLFIRDSGRMTGMMGKELIMTVRTI